MRRPGMFIAPLVLAFGCASADVPRPSPAISVTQLSRVAPVKMRVSSGLPVDYAIEIANPLADPLTLTSIEIETVGQSGAYWMKRVRHTFSLTVAPRTKEVITIRAWVHTLQENERGDVTAPVTVRGVATFGSASGVLKTAFASRVQ